MGNTTSVIETLPPHPASTNHDPRVSPGKRQPQKLSKPRVGNYASSTGRTRCMSSSAVSVASSNTPLPLNPNAALRRQSTILSPVPLSPLPPSNASTRASHAGPPSEVLPPAPPEPPEPERRLSLFRPKSSQDDRRSSRRSTGPLSSMSGDRCSRANSMNWESEANFEYARRQAESNQTPGSRQSVNYDMASYEASRLMLQQEILSPGGESVLSGSNNHDGPPESWNGQDELQHTLSRVNSEVSLYPPVRRTSIVQTPGVATRWPGDAAASASVSVSRHSSMRHSHPPTPVMAARVRLDSLDSSTARIMALPPPPRPIYPEGTPRVETPSDGEYKQLGTMKFGSLRITNGAASPIPSLESDHQLGSDGDRNRPTSQPQDEANLMTDVVANFDGEELVVVAVGRAEEISTPLTPRLVEVGKLSRASSFRSQGVPTAALSKPLPELPQFDDFQPKPSRETSGLGIDPNDALFEYSTNETLDIREDADAKPKLDRPSVNPAQGERSLARTDSGFVGTPMSEASLKALSKADSGYSSNVSVRSFASKKISGSGTQSPSQSVDDCSVEISVSRPSDLTEGDLHNTTGPKLVVDTTTFDLLTAPSPTSTRSAASPISPRTRPPVVSRNNHLSPSAVSPRDQQPVSPVSERRRSGLWPSQSKSTLSIGGEPAPKSRRNKLQRLLSGASLRGGPPSVHAAHPEEQSVPGVPKAVEDKLQEHSGRFPTNSKRLTMQRQLSKDTLKTILSVGSVDALQSDSVRNSLVAVDESAPVGPAREPVKVSRRRSIQSAASLISRTSLRRKPVGSGDRHEAQHSDHEVIPNGFESHITSIDAIRSSVGRSAFDSAFAMMRVPDNEGDRRDRSMTMDAQTEREMDLRRQASRGRNLRAAAPSSRASPIPELPEMSPTALKARTPPPPISLQNRSARSIRKNPSSRPQSTSSTPRQGLSRHGSRESVQSHRSGQDDHGQPPMPALDARFPEFQHLRRQEGQPSEAERARRESAPGPLTSHPNPGGRRPSSTAPNTLRKQPPSDLRRQSSYEDHLGRRRSLSRQSYPESRDPPASGSYYHNQLRQLQDQQWGGQGWDEPSRYPPHGPPARHSWSRTGGPRGRNYDPPYRILHSYNSPAYRNVPIWG